MQLIQLPNPENQLQLLYIMTYKNTNFFTTQNRILLGIQNTIFKSYQRVMHGQCPKYQTQIFQKVKKDKRVRFLYIKQIILFFIIKTTCIKKIRHSQLQILTFLRTLKFNFVNFYINVSYTSSMSLNIWSELKEKSIVLCTILQPMKC